MRLRVYLSPDRGCVHSVQLSSLPRKTTITTSAWLHHINPQICSFSYLGRRYSLMNSSSDTSLAFLMPASAVSFARLDVIRVGRWELRFDACAMGVMVIRDAVCTVEEGQSFVIFLCHQLSVIVRYMLQQFRIAASLAVIEPPESKRGLASLLPRWSL